MIFFIDIITAYSVAKFSVINIDQMSSFKTMFHKTPVT